MKKSLILVLTVALTLLCLTSCSVFDVIFGSEKGLTYKEYENCAVFTFDGFDGKTSVKLSRTGLDEGAIYYQASLDKGALDVKYKDSGYINEPSMLAELTANEQMPINGSGGYVEKTEIEISFEANSPVSGEIIIAFTEDALKAIHKDKYLHEHTYETYQDEISHGWSYTCGCMTPPNSAQHFDGDENGYCDECEYYVGIKEPKRAFLHECEGWLLNLDAESVEAIKTTFEYVGVAPGELKEIKSTSDKSVIADIVEKYAYLEMTSISREETFIDGGSAFTIEFIFTDGTEKILNFNNLNYVCGSNQDEISALSYFRLDHIPTLQGEAWYNNVRSYSSFITYIDVCVIYSGEELICEIPVNELEFVRIEKEQELPLLPKYIAETEFGNLIFLTDTVFYIDLIDGGYSNKYVLVGKNIDEIIAECVELEEE